MSELSGNLDATISLGLDQESRALLASASAVIFDFDGVIADSEEFQLSVWQELLLEDGLAIDGLTIGSIAGVPDRIAIERSVPGLNPDYYANLEHRKKVRCRQRFHTIRLVPFSEAVLRRLQKTKELHICSSSDEDVIRTFLKMRLPDVRFGQVVGRSRYQRPKPAPDSYLTTLRAAGLSPTDVVAVEDSDAGAAAARAAGLHVIKLERYNASLPTYAIRSLQDLLIAI